MDGSRRIQLQCRNVGLRLSGDYTGEGDATVRIGFDAVQWVLDGGPCGSAPLLTDTDVDRVPDGNDDCPTTYDPNQTNTDVLLNPPGDALGDACDPDDDNDGLLDAVETNTTVFVGSSDTGTNPLIPDSDGDACGDSMKIRSSHVAGGERDPNDKWDFYDVPVPALLLGYSGQMRDRGIGVTTDVIALLHYTGKTSGDPDYIANRDGNGVEDGLQYDRRLSTTPGQPWRSSAPDGGIGVTTDVIAMLAQAGNTCA